MKHFISLVLALALLAAGVYYVKTTEKKESAKVRALYAAVEPLERERTTLQKELSDLKGSYGLKMRDYGTIEILFPVMDKQIISQTYPIMRDSEVVGILGFSLDELPGDSGKLELADAQRLLSEGWGFCLVYDQHWHNFRSWYDSISHDLKKKKLPVPTSIYFPGSTYQEDYAEEFAACGITTVVLDAEDGRSNTVTDPTGELWYTGAMPWNYTGFSTDVELIGRTNGSNLCFILNFAGEWEPKTTRAAGDGSGQRQKEDFLQIFSSWASMIYAESPLDELEKLSADKALIQTNSEMSEAVQELYYDSLTPEQQLLLPRFRIVTLEEARSCHSEALAHNEAMQRELEQTQRSLETRLAELDEEIRRIYDEFSKDTA